MIATDLHIPTLETPRLILRAHRLEDFEAMVGATQAAPGADRTVEGQGNDVDPALAQFGRDGGKGC